MTNFESRGVASVSPPRCKATRVVTAICYNHLMRILVFGDSIAIGFWDREGGWVSRLRRLTDTCTLKDTGYDRTVYNLGIAGNTTRDILARFESETKVRLGDHELVIIFAIGINDSYFVDNKQAQINEKYFTENIQKLISRAKKYAVKIVFVGLNPVDEIKVSPMAGHSDTYYRNDQIDLYNSIIRNLCERSHIYFIDIMRDFKKRDYTLLLADGAHPNSAGHKVMFELVRDFLTAKGII